MTTYGRMTDAFGSIFADNEWFNKVLVGGFFFLLVPAGIGIVMLNGFLTLFLHRRKKNEAGMPYWRNYKLIFTAGRSTSIPALVILIASYILWFINGHRATLSTTVIAVILLLAINSIVLTRALHIPSLLVSLILLSVALCLGWMWIVVGWPLLVFLALLVQADMLRARA